MPTAKRHPTDKLELIALASIGVAVAVLGLKYLAYWRTGSVALYSDALESVVNLITALVALYTIRVASQPADGRHQFGHHKAEYFSAVIEGVLIIVAALLILREAYDAYVSPRALSNLNEGLGFNIGAMLVNGVWCAFLIRWGRRHRSPALVGEGWHLLTDVVTSVGVVAGLVLAAVTGWAILDPALAAVVAVNILWSGVRLMRESVGGLMDEAVAAEVERQIREVIASNAAGAIEAHDVKTRTAGRVTFIEFHLVVPATMTVATSHEICDRLETALTEAVQGAEVLIHVEPEGEAKQTGVPVV
jgi:cation diffusion facilitator family transporter